MLQQAEVLFAVDLEINPAVRGRYGNRAHRWTRFKARAAGRLRLKVEIGEENKH